MTYRELKRRLKPMVDGPTRDMTNHEVESALLSGPGLVFVGEGQEFKSAFEGLQVVSYGGVVWCLPVRSEDHATRIRAEFEEPERLDLPEDGV